MSEKLFLVGDWYNEELNAHCPIGKCSMSDAEYAGEVGEDYDDWAQAEYRLDQIDTLTETQAKQVWKSLVDYYKRNQRTSEHASMAAMYESKLDLAKAVQSKLGW